MINGKLINSIFKILRLLAKVSTGVLLFLLPHFVLAQQGAVWTFGINSGLDFNTTPPNFFNPVLNSYSSSGTICDKQGKLLLYTDGKRIYNKYYQVIENGDSINGWYGGGQGCIIVQHPGNEALYYVLTVWRGESSTQSKNWGLYYSIVDVSDPQKNGKVIKKNILVKNGIFNYLTAVRHSNKQDLWILTKLGADTFYSYCLSNTGINSPVKSPCSRPVPRDTTINGGNLKSSHDGKTLIECYYNLFDQGSNRIAYSYINSFDFDNTSGIIRNKKNIASFYTRDARFNYYSFWDVAFSPNDSLIYVTDWGRDSANNKSRDIRQYKRYDSDISKSYILLPDENRNTYQTSVQLGPDGKIYIGSYKGRSTDNNIYGSFINVIHYPNREGANCKLTFRDYKLPIENSYVFFPNMFFEYLRANFSYNQNCNKYCNFINKGDTSVFKYFTWYFSETDSTSGLNASYSYAKSGKYLVKLLAETPKGYKQWYSDSILYLKPPNANFSFQSNTGCQWVGFQFKDSSVTDTINAVSGQSWRWDFGDGSTDTARNPIHFYTKSGNYTVRLIYSNGFCSDTFTTTQNITILEAPKPGFTVSVTKGCTPLKVELKDKSDGTAIKYFYDFGNSETDTVASPSVVYTKPGIYKIKQELLGQTGCITSDSVFINVIQGISPSDAPKLEYASVTAKNIIEITWQPLFAAEKYFVYRNYEGSSSSTFKLIAETNNTTFTDTLINPSEASFIYKIIAKDSCGNVGKESNIGKTILLKAKNENNKFAILQWTPYEDWKAGGVASYILESTDSADHYTEIAHLSVSNISFTDNNFWSKEKQQKYYRIKAISAANAQIQSVSNIICLPYIPQLWIPTAFSPNDDKLNDTFRIICTGIAELEMQIFNRWGEKVCTIDNTNVGWDGKYNGEKVPTGEYVYVLKAKGTDQQKIYTSGSLQVIR